MEIFATLVGVPFRGKPAMEIVKKLTPDDGELLKLKAEPTNEYDSNAVMVIYEPTEEHIGYLAKENNEAIAAALNNDPNLPYTIEIVGFENSVKPTLLITSNIGHLAGGLDNA